MLISSHGKLVLQLYLILYYKLRSAILGFPILSIMVMECLSSDTLEIGIRSNIRLGCFIVGVG